MTHNGADLQNLMILFPDLHPRHLAATGVVTLKVLRLVCKSLGATALAAVQSCEVHLGESAACPSPAQLSKLMERSKLLHLKVIVTVSSEITAASESQQRALCLSQMNCLCSEMGDAIEGVTRLTLHVAHRQSKQQVFTSKARRRRILADDQRKMQQNVDWKLNQLKPQYLEYQGTLLNVVNMLKQTCMDEQLSQQHRDERVRKLRKKHAQMIAAHKETWMGEWIQLLPQPLLPTPDQFMWPSDLLSPEARELAQQLPRSARQQLQDRCWQLKTKALQELHLDACFDFHAVDPMVMYQRHFLQQQYCWIVSSRGLIALPQHGVIPLSILGRKPQERMAAPFPIQSTCSSSLGGITRSSFALLADAVPNVCELTLSGCCWAPALKSFGESCPQLVSLVVQAPQVPVEAIEYLGSEIPHITSITIGSMDVTVADEEQLTWYFETLVVALHNCRNITSLNIQFPECIILGNRFWQGRHMSGWTYLPTSLKFLTCSCRVEADGYMALIHRIPNLHLFETPTPSIEIHGVADLLLNFSMLKSCTLCTMLPLDLDFCDSSRNSDEASVLKERLLVKDFHLYVHALCVSGNCQQMQELFTWFPAFTATYSLRLRLQGSMHNKSLNGLLRVFPGVEWLTVDGSAEREDDNWELHEELLMPLFACPSLKVLTLNAQVRLTTSWLVRLCRSMPQLAHLSFWPCEGTDRNKLVTGLQQIGRSIAVVQDDDHLFLNISP